jgi:hypothetical protein
LDASKNHPSIPARIMMPPRRVRVLEKLKIIEYALV